MRSHPAVLVLVSSCLALSLGACSTGSNNGGSGSNPVLASLSISPGTATVNIGATQQFTATAKDTTGAVMSGVTFSWNTSNSSSATVNASGLVTGVAPGTANITVTAGSITSPAAIVTVPTPPVASITLNPTSANMVAGDTEQFTATAKDSNGNTLSGVTFTWASSNTSAATVNSSGLVTAVAAGSANITAASGGITSSPAAVTVNPPPTASVTIGPASPTINVGATQQFTATAKDLKGNPISGATFTWSSSDTAVATIDNNGLATGLKAGSSNITATSGGVTSSADVLTVVQPASVTGTAAMGTPISSQIVTLKDSAGNSATATTDSTGNFSVNTSGMTPPYLLEVTPSGASAPIYSVSVGSTLSQTVNIDPLTDLIVRSYYAASLNTTPAVAFGNPSSFPAPNTTQAGVVGQFVLNQVALWLNNNGIATDANSNFNLISTPFMANGIGYDKVLDETAINLSNANQPAMTVTDGTTTQSTQFSFNSSTHAVSAATTTTNANGSTSSTSSTLVPGSGAQTTAFQAIQAQLAALSQVINTKGTALADTDIEPFMTSNIEFDGLTPEEAAAYIATTVRGEPTTISLVSLTSLDTTAGTASGIMQLDVNGSVLSKQTNFATSGGNWLWAGDGQIGQVNVDTVEFRSYGGNPVSQTKTYTISAEATTPLGQVTGATINGSVFNNVTLAKQATQSETLAPTATTTETVNLDDWFYQAMPSNIVPAGQNVTVTLTPASGTPVQYQFLTGASTTDAPSYNGITSTSLSALNLGGSNSFSWNLPTTFAVRSITLHANAYNGDPSSSGTVDCVVPDKILAPTATSGSLTLPSSCSGSIVEVDINVKINGVDGEESGAYVVYR